MSSNHQKVALKSGLKLTVSFEMCGIRMATCLLAPIDLVIFSTPKQICSMSLRSNQQLVICTSTYVLAAKSPNCYTSVASLMGSLAGLDRSPPMEAFSLPYRDLGGGGEPMRLLGGWVGLLLRGSISEPWGPPVLFFPSPPGYSQPKMILSGPFQASVCKGRQIWRVWMQAQGSNIEEQDAGI